MWLGPVGLTQIRFCAIVAWRQQLFLAYNRIQGPPTSGWPLFRALSPFAPHIQGGTDRSLPFSLPESSITRIYFISAPSIALTIVSRGVDQAVKHQFECASSPTTHLRLWSATCSLQRSSGGPRIERFPVGTHHRLAQLKRA